METTTIVPPPSDLAKRRTSKVDRRVSMAPGTKPEGSTRKSSLSYGSAMRRKSSSAAASGERFAGLARRESLRHMDRELRRDSMLARRNSADVTASSVASGRLHQAASATAPTTRARRRESIEVQMSRLARVKSHEVLREQREMKRKKEREALTKAPKDRTPEDLDALDNFLLKVSFFDNLKEETRMRILSAVEYECAEPCTVLCREGEIGDTFYIVIEGRCGVRVFDTQRDVDVGVGFVRQGESFGEHALHSSGSRRTATVVCCNTVHLLKLHQSDYNRILRESNERLTHEKVNFLRHVQLGIFDDFPASILEDLASTMTTKSFEKNQVIIKQGAIVDEMYFIIRGEVRLLKETLLDASLVSKVERMASERPKAFCETLRSASSYSKALNTSHHLRVRNDARQTNRDTGSSVSLTAPARPSTTGCTRRPASRGGTFGPPRQRRTETRPASAMDVTTTNTTTTGAKPPLSVSRGLDTAKENAEDGQSSQRKPVRSFLEVGVLGLHECFGDLTGSSATITQSFASRHALQNASGEKIRPTSINFSVVSTCHLECYVLNKWDVSRKLAMHEDAFEKFQQRLKERNDTYVANGEIASELQRTINWSSYRDKMVRSINHGRRAVD